MASPKRWVYGSRSKKWHLVGSDDRDYKCGITQAKIKKIGKSVAKEKQKVCATRRKLADIRGRKTLNLQQRELDLEAEIEELPPGKKRSRLKQELENIQGRETTALQQAELDAEAELE